MVQGLLQLYTDRPDNFKSFSIAMATKDMLIEAYAMIVELKAEIAVVHTHLQNLERVLGTLQEAHGITVPKRECPARDPKDEQEHKRLKACFQYQKRGETKTATLGNWSTCFLSGEVKEEPSETICGPTVPGLVSANEAPSLEEAIEPTLRAA